MSNKTFISYHDFADLYREFKRSSLTSILSRFHITRKAKIRATWDRQVLPNKNWSAIQRIVEFTNKLCTGNERMEYTNYIANKYLKSKVHLKGLSIGSGRGHFEIEWARATSFYELIGVDISKKCVDSANRRAQENKMSEVNFCCGDLLNMSLPEDYYDIVICHASLHHMKHVSALIQRIFLTLKKGGLFVVDEYVGPRRMQYTDKQIKIANELLSKIPMKYKKRWNLKSIKNEIHRPGILRMILSDPSEAVESDLILEQVQKHFKTVELALRGGTILSPLFHDIGSNFTNDDPQANEIVDECIATERKLIENGEIGCDFIIGLFQKDS